MVNHLQVDGPTILKQINSESISKIGSIKLLHIINYIGKSTFASNLSIIISKSPCIPIQTSNPTITPTLMAAIPITQAAPTIPNPPSTPPNTSPTSPTSNPAPQNYTGLK
jgi:hypothetical protein